MLQKETEYPIHDNRNIDLKTSGVWSSSKTSPISLSTLIFICSRASHFAIIPNNLFTYAQTRLFKNITKIYYRKEWRTTDSTSFKLEIFKCIFLSECIYMFHSWHRSVCFVYIDNRNCFVDAKYDDTAQSERFLLFQKLSTFLWRIGNFIRLLLASKWEIIIFFFPFFFFCYRFKSME